MTMSSKKTTSQPAPMGAEDTPKILRQYGCGPIKFTGTANAFYERHLLFDHVLDVEDAGPRDRFEAAARSVRDVLSQRWIRTEKTYEMRNPKRIYYLSMEFLIGRSLTNNITNLLLDPIVKKAVEQEKFDLLEIIHVPVQREMDN
mgnify:CR=1 FL=1